MVELVVFNHILICTVCIFPDSYIHYTGVRSGIMDEEKIEDSLQGVTGSRVMTKDSAQEVTGSRVMTEDSPRRVIRYSVRPPSHFAGKGADFRLWMQCIELYFREAEVPEDKSRQQLATL